MLLCVVVSFKVVVFPGVMYGYESWTAKRHDKRNI